jgi:DNA-binding SARP family transcriptional activator
MAAEFRLLGPVAASLDGEPVQIAAAKPRGLLALLLLRRNRPVSISELIDELWEDEPPETATKALQVYVSQLRKAIGAERVLTRPAGYELRVEEGELDLERFEGLVREGRDLLAAGEAGAASERLEEALGLWRGPALGDVTVARDAAARLEESRLAAVEERIEADLALGRHDRLVPELEELVARNPLRERLHAQRMLALYRSGRQAEALDEYRRTRELLVGELGIEPGPELKELEAAILRQDPELSVERARPRATAAAREAAPARRRAWVGLALVVAAAAVAALVAVALTRGGSGASDVERRAFVNKVENFLVQSREGRAAVVSTLARQARCKLSPRAAVESLNRVQRNRQSLLQQVAALAVPADDAAVRSADMLQKSVQASIAADRHYHDWLVARTRCGPGDASPEFRAALSEDGVATRAKRNFVKAFTPLAERFHERVWTDAEF